MWGFCSNIEQNFPLDKFIKVKPTGYDSNSNEIIYSIKACTINDYDKLANSLNKGDSIVGKVIKHFTDIARIEISIDGSKIQGYVHKSEISNIEYVDSDDIEKFLPIETQFNYILKRKDDKNKILELSRKKYLDDNEISMDYGDTIEVSVIKVVRNYAYFYSNDIEGRITENFKTLTEGQLVEVFLINEKGEYSA